MCHPQFNISDTVLHDINCCLTGCINLSGFCFTGYHWQYMIIDIQSMRGVQSSGVFKHLFLHYQQY